LIFNYKMAIEFEKRYKDHLFNLFNYSFLKHSNCVGMINNLTNENYPEFIKECTKYLFELSNQNKYIANLIKTCQIKHPTHKDNYDFILCKIYEMEDFKYGSAINGMMWIELSLQKLNKLYRKYQQLVDKFNKLEENNRKKEEEYIAQINRRNEYARRRYEAYYENIYNQRIKRLPIYRFFHEKDELSTLTKDMWEIPKNMHFEDDTYYINGIGYNDY
jgi:hypothetical protein